MATTDRDSSRGRPGATPLLSNWVRAFPPSILLIAAWLLLGPWTAAAQPDPGAPRPAPPEAPYVGPAESNDQPPPTSEVRPSAPAIQPSPSAVAKPSPSAVAKPSPSAVAKPGGAAAPSEPGWAWINRYVSLTALLAALGAGLLLLAGIAWYRSNRAEAAPGPEHLAQMRRFVEEDFARFVAAGLPLEVDEAPLLSRDDGWRTLFTHHVKLHNELYRFSTRTALAIYTAHVDDAVRRALTERRALLANDPDGKQARVATGPPV